MILTDFRTFSRLPSSALTLLTSHPKRPWAGKAFSFLPFILNFTHEISLLICWSLLSRSVIRFRFGDREWRRRGVKRSGKQWKCFTERSMKCSSLNGRQISTRLQLTADAVQFSKKRLSSGKMSKKRLEKMKKISLPKFWSQRRGLLGEREVYCSNLGDYGKVNDHSQENNRRS